MTWGILHKTSLGILYTGLVTTSDEGHTVFAAGPKIIDKSYIIKEIQLYRQNGETGVTTLQTIRRVRGDILLKSTR